MKQKPILFNLKNVLFYSGCSLGSWKENVCYQTLWVLWQEISAFVGENWNTIGCTLYDHEKIKVFGAKVANNHHHLDLVQQQNKNSRIIYIAESW